MELLRFATVGSVDDGKSTLIGRLLYDAKSIFEDQWDAIEHSSRNRGEAYVNLALLTDGLRAEREQGITIDVAYRYFATPQRKFIIADTPGHVQYTRNMVTGASNAQVALILVDVRQGVVEQSRRHAYISSLLGIRHFVVCVNKMDLVEYRQDAFDAVRRDFSEFAQGLGPVEVTYIPISALLGDNVVEPSAQMPWYSGNTLLRYLESVDPTDEEEWLHPRFPVQLVIRPMRHEYHDYRGYAGTVAGGILRTGDEVVVLPGGRRSRIDTIDTFEGPIAEATPAMSVTLRLQDDIDVSRGNMIALASAPPTAVREFDAWVCWMSERTGMAPGGRYAIKHTTHAARAVVETIAARLDINELSEAPAASLGLNDIGRVRLRTSEPVFIDTYADNRRTGSFILIDETTNDTVAAGMIIRPLPAEGA